MIIKIGGTNGSGKTCLARAFMRRWNFVPITYPGKEKVQEYVAKVRAGEPLSRLFDKVVVLGDYRNVCGGMDAIAGKELRLAMVEKYCEERRTLVLYEGVLTGVTYGAMGELSDRSKVPWLYVFMDTPYETCVERVMERRKAKGNLTPFDGMRSLHPKIRACESVARRAADHGHETYWVSFLQKPSIQVEFLLSTIERLVKIK